MRRRRPRLIPPFFVSFILLCGLAYIFQPRDAGGDWMVSFKPAAITRTLAAAAGSAIDSLYRSANRGRIEHAKTLVREIAEEAGRTEDSIAEFHGRAAGIPRMPTPPGNAGEKRDSGKILSAPTAPGMAALPTTPSLHASDYRAGENAKGIEAESVSKEKPPPRARTFRLLLIGVDSRLGRSDARADALHVVSVDLERASVQITAIPRGTRVPIGYQNEASNIISNLRNARGRAALMKAAAEIAGGGQIAYYVEVGFSQAMGVLELLGYPNPSAELAFLRRREGLQYGDRERSYAQALFLRRTLLRSFNLLTGVTGELLLSTGLLLVETNLTKEICQGLIYSLQEKGFPRTENAVSVILHSPFERQVARRVGEGEMESAEAVPLFPTKAEIKLRRLLGRGSGAEPPGNTLRVMERVFDQRGWLQIPDPRERRILRDSLAGCLLRAYTRAAEHEKIRSMQERLRGEDSLFHTLRSAKISSLP